MAFVFMNIGTASRIIQYEELRYLIYFPFILGIFFIIKNKFRMEAVSLKHYPLNTAFFLILISASLNFLNLSMIGLYQLLFITAALLPFLVFKEFNINWRIVSIIHIVGYLIVVSGQPITFNYSLESLINSTTSSLETNQHPFVFGILTLYFLHKKDHKWFLINLLMVLISLKRIVLLGTLVTIPFIYLEQNKQLIFHKARWIFPMVNLMLIYFILALPSGLYNNLIQEYTSVSPGYLTMGRNALYGEILEAIRYLDIYNILFGMGQGYAYSITYNYFFTSPHCDLLVLLIDHGILFYILFFGLLYRNKYLFPVIYTNIIWLTDNTLIYTFYLFTLLAINQSILASNDNSCGNNP